MVTYKDQDILLITHGLIVHGCNNLGFFNKGIAKSIREKYPLVYLDYINNYKESKLGDIIITKLTNDLIVCSAITQARIGNNPNKRYVSYDAIYEAFNKVNNLCIKENINTVYFPKIGSGLGNGNWNIIEKIIDITLKIDNKICCTI